jgi:hypothetical protein
MADTKISALTGATTPLAGTEVLPIVQSGTTVKVSAANITAGRAVTGLSFATANMTVGASGVTAGTDVSYSANAAATQTVSAAYTTGSFRPALKMYSVGVNHDMILQFTDLCRFYNAAGDTKFYVDHLNSKVGSSYNLAFDNGKGIDFSATPGTGTSELLADYEEGTWTPLQGSGLTVVGTFSSSGTYTKIGRQVTVQGKVAGSTSISCSAFGIITSTMPFSSGATAFLGSLASYSPDDGGTASTINGVLYSVEAVAASSGGIEFTIVLFV